MPTLSSYQSFLGPPDLHLLGALFNPPLEILESCLGSNQTYLF